MRNSVSFQTVSELERRLPFGKQGPPQRGSPKVRRRRHGVIRIDPSDGVPDPLPDRCS